MSKKFRCRSTDRCLSLRRGVDEKSSSCIQATQWTSNIISERKFKCRWHRHCVQTQVQVQDKTGKCKIHNYTGTDKHANVLCTESLSFSLSLSLSLSLSVTRITTKENRKHKQKKTITEMKVLALHFNLPGDSTLRSADRHWPVDCAKCDDGR